MVGHSMTRAPRSSRAERNSEDCAAARVMTTVLPLSAILGDLGKNVSSAHRQQLLTKLQPELNRSRVRAREFVGNDSTAIEARDQPFDRKPVSVKCCFACNRHLAAAAQSAKQAPLGRDGRSGGLVVQDVKKVLRDVVR